MAPLPSWSNHESGHPRTMGQNRDNDENMPHRVAPSADIIDPAPFGAPMSSIVHDWTVRVIEFYFRRDGRVRIDRLGTSVMMMDAMNM